MTHGASCTWFGVQIEGRPGAGRTGGRGEGGLRVWAASSAEVESPDVALGVTWGGVQGRGWGEVRGQVCLHLQGEAWSGDRGPAHSGERSRGQLRFSALTRKGPSWGTAQVLRVVAVGQELDSGLLTWTSSLVLTSCLASSGAPHPGPSSELRRPSAGRRVLPCQATVPWCRWALGG